MKDKGEIEVEKTGRIQDVYMHSKVRRSKELQTSRRTGWRWMRKGQSGKEKLEQEVLWGPCNLSGVKRKHFTESQRTALQFKLSASFVMQNVHRGETGGRQEDTAVVTG